MADKQDESTLVRNVAIIATIITAVVVFLLLVPEFRREQQPQEQQRIKVELPVVATPVATVLIVSKPQIAPIPAPVPAPVPPVPVPAPPPALTKMQQLGRELDAEADDPTHSTHIDRFNEKLQDALKEDDENNAELNRRFEKAVEDSKNLNDDK
ncbi:MAG: hypothetical protein WCJ35_07515 [Planctomycetota bacterium]